MKRTLLLSVLLSVFTVLAAWGQQTTGQLNGTVEDSSGAVVTNAQVSARNPETGLQRTAATGGTGDYVIALLPPGTYEVRVQAPGFTTAVQKNVPLLVGTAVTLDFKLKPGAASEVVEVTSEPPIVDVTHSDIGGNVTPTEIKDLPVRDRNFASLMALVPGVRPAPNFDPTKSRSGTVSAGGSDGRAWDYNVDGGDDKDNVIGGIVQNYTLEGIQEFNVVTQRYSAESGRSVGGVVNVITKSGTNKLHGSGFGEFQNSALNAKSAFDRTAGPDQKLFTADDVQLPKPNFKRYYFGGSIGGPIIKDKLFFFGAYEHKRELASINPDPTAVENLLLLPQYAQVASKILTPYFDHLATIKLDYRLNDRQSMFLRYGRERWTTLNDQPTQAGPPISDLTEATANVNQFHSLVLQHNIIISNTKVNTLTFQFQDFVNAITATPGRTFSLTIAGGGSAVNPLLIFPSAELGNNGNVPQQTLIRKYQLRDDFNWTKGRHNLKFGANWIYLAKLGGFFDSTPGYNIYFFDDPVDIFGSKSAFYPQGVATPGAVSELTYTAGNSRTDNPLRPHELGLYLQDDFKVTPHLTLNLGLRWDANIHMLNPQLTSNPLTSNRAIAVLRQLVADNPSAPGAQEGLAEAKFLAGNDSALRRTTASWKEFQPRLGFAWDPTGSGKVVIRGGYGIARDQIFQNLTLWSIQQSNTTVYQTLIDISSPAPLAAAPTVPCRTTWPADPTTASLDNFCFGVTPLPPAASAATDLAFGARGRINRPDITDPWSQQMSIGTAIELKPDLALTVDFTHVLGTHEPRMLDSNPKLSFLCDPLWPTANPADPRCVNGTATRLLDAALAASGIGVGRFSDIRTVATNNRSRYDGLNVVVRKRMTHHFTFQSSYVLSWSRSWGGVPVASYGGSFLTSDPRFQFRPNNYGYTDNDERHRFTFSGVFDLTHGFELAPLFQAASARPIDPYPNTDIDGDGRPYLDRVCAPFNPATFDPANPPASTFAKGCNQVPPNSLRGFPFVQMDLSAAKTFKLGERVSARLSWQFYNLFNRFNKCNSVSNDASGTSFLQPLSGPISGPYCAVTGGVFGTGGGSFGPGISTPFRSQLGLRIQF
jgi:Carboxypeptidase regulatory-like domain/TonB dependent receptor-like, beta-barrel